MNPMYPTESVFSVLQGVLSLVLGLGMLALLGFLAYKFAGSKAFRRFRDGLDLHAARTGYNRGLEDADVFQEHRMLQAELKEGIAGVTAQLEELRQKVTVAASEAENGTAVAGRAVRTKVPRRIPRRIVPALGDIPFVSTRPLGLSLP